MTNKSLVALLVYLLIFSACGNTSKERSSTQKMKFTGFPIVCWFPQTKIDL